MYESAEWVGPDSDGYDRIPDGLSFFHTREKGWGIRMGHPTRAVVIRPGYLVKYGGRVLAPTDRIRHPTRTITVYWPDRRAGRRSNVYCHIDGWHRDTRTYATFINQPSYGEQTNCEFYSIVGRDGTMGVVVWIDRILQTRGGQYKELLVSYRDGVGGGFEAGRPGVDEEQAPPRVRAHS